jgi:hypothetical protein
VLALVSSGRARLRSPKYTASRRNLALLVDETLTCSFPVRRRVRWLAVRMASRTRARLILTAARDALAPGTVVEAGGGSEAVNALAATASSATTQASRSGTGRPRAIFGLAGRTGPPSSPAPIGFREPPRHRRMSALARRHRPLGSGPYERGGVTKSRCPLFFETPRSK